MAYAIWEVDMNEFGDADYEFVVAADCKSALRAVADYMGIELKKDVPIARISDGGRFVVLDFDPPFEPDNCVPHEWW